MKQNTKKAFDALLSVIDENLKPLGFIRKGSIFRLLDHNNCGIIEFQQSDKSTQENLVFTINLGVACGDILCSGSSSISKARIIDAHLRQRIGMFLPERPDKWWDLNPSVNSELLAQEVTDLLLKKGVPYIKGLLETKALVALWESGQSPGLTAFQRTRYLSLLKR